MRACIALISASFAVMSFVTAQAQSIDDFKPELLCSGTGLEEFDASGGCDPTSPISKMVSENAVENAAVWKVLFPDGQSLGYTRLSGKDPIFAITEKQTLDPVTRTLLERAEGPAFYDAVSGTIQINADTVFDSVADGALDAALSRAIGLSVLANYPPARDVLKTGSASPTLMSAFEGLAGIPAVVSDTGGKGISQTRDYSEPLFGELDKSTSWGTARFWSEALRRAVKENGIELKEASKNLFAHIAASSHVPQADAGELIQITNEAFRQMGWTRFETDGFAYAYAEIMAEHLLDTANLLTPVENLNYTPGISTLVIDGELPSGFATSFYELKVNASGVRESFVDISLCAYEGDTNDCEDDDRLHLGIDGVIASQPNDAKHIKTKAGTLLPRPSRNQVRSTIQSLVAQRANKTSSAIPISVSVTNDDGKPVKFRLKVSGAVLEPPCSWSSMTASLNPWWRGNLSSPDSLIPNHKDIPANMRAEISESLKSQWYLTEAAWRAENDWDHSIFAGSAGQARLKKIQNFLSDEQISEAISLEQDITKTQADVDLGFLMPSRAKAIITGAFSDGGDVCVSPVTVSEMPGFERLTDLAGKDLGKLLSEMGLPPEILTAKSEAELLAIVMAMRGSVSDLEPKRDVVLQIFSPNLWTQQTGLLLPGAAKPLSHSGHNGWKRNAGVNLYVRLPGTSPADLKPGRYRASATVQFIKDPNAEGFDPDRAMPFYVRGWGAAEKTEYEDFIENGLAGWLTIEKQAFGVATAKLELAGQTWKNATKKPGEPSEGAEVAGPVQFRINRFLMLGVSKDEPLPVLSPLNLMTAQIPSPE